MKRPTEEGKSNMLQLAEKVGIVTGASGDIGRAVSMMLAKHGAFVVGAGYKNEESLKNQEMELAREGKMFKYVIGDIANEEFCVDLINKVITTHGRLDFLVNCAGTISRAAFLQMSAESWHEVLGVNLHGPMYMCKHVIPKMKAGDGGRIVNVTSQVAFRPHIAAAPSYEVSKAGLTALTRHLAAKFASDNIMVNAIAPGSIDTQMPKNMTEEARQKLLSDIPQGRLGMTEEVANGVLFLISPMSNYITGTTMHVNGGSLFV